MPTGIPYHPNDDDRNMLEAALFFDVPLKDIARCIGVTIPTLKRHYGDVIQRAQLKRGPKPHDPSELEKEVVVKMAAVGMPHADIARFVHVGKGTLQRHYRKELLLGLARANFAVGKKMLEMATGDSTNPNTVIAAIWWSKARMGWKDTSRVEITGADRGPIRNQGQVMVWLPDNGRGNCSAPVVQGPPSDADAIGERPTADEGESSGS